VVLTRTIRNHQFDLLRILFAILVVYSHAFELTDGNNKRELLCRITHQDFSFGMLAVDGFFLLSGYLIVKSWMSKPKLLDFTRKRFLRIAPGYAVATLTTTYVIGFLAPTEAHQLSHLRLDFARSLLFIFPPSSPDVFPGNHDRILNGSLWTILFEFRCYVLVAIFGILGLLRKPVLWLSATAVLLVFLLRQDLALALPWSTEMLTLLGKPDRIARLAAVFFVGGCFYLYRSKVPFTPVLAIASVVSILIVRLAFPASIETAFVLGGSYLLFYFTHRPIAAFAWMSNVPDVSYGLYLYAWPVESYLIWKFHASPWVVFFQATLISICLGWLSWTLVERPALSLRPSRKQKTQGFRNAAFLDRDRDASTTPIVLEMPEMEAKPSDNLVEPG
jgi:peptidoglycan/LPS O-acetylase OafA/YrhL